MKKFLIASVVILAIIFLQMMSLGKAAGAGKDTTSTIISNAYDVFALDKSK